MRFSGFLLSGRLAAIGFSCSLFLAACGGSGGTDDGPIVYVQSIPAEQQRVIPTEESKVFVTNSAFAAELKECALTPSTNPCTLARLPYIGQSSPQPTVEDVMQRVVVTHDWMGVRFEQMLRRMPSDILELFAPVTSIVIGSEVRPSAVYPTKGQMRLDPRYLWLSVAEKRTVSGQSDFRSEYGADLKFRGFWRLALGDSYASTYFSIEDDSVREIDDLDISLARLLYHELAHANDFVQYSVLSGLSPDLTPASVLDLYDDSAVWRQLHAQEELTAQQSYLYGLAAVRYFDRTPTDDQKNMFADFVGSEMGNEGKMTFYGYSTQREDVATLFAAAMMNYHYDVEYHIGFADKPANQENISCNDYKVAWGERNRLASPLVAPRARFVVDKLMRPSANRDQFFETGLGASAPLRVGAGWCESVSRSTQFGKRTQAAALPPPVELNAH